MKRVSVVCMGVWALSLPLCVSASRDVSAPVDRAGPIREMIESFYTLALGREAEPGAVDAWQAYFDYAMDFNIDARFVPREMARLFFLSEEYASRNRSDAEFIADCYRVFLEREPREAELASWLGGTWNRGEALTVFSESEEFAARIATMYPGLEGDPIRNFVATIYIGLLGRLVDRAGLECASALFEAAKEQGGFEGIREQAEQMVREIIASDEFQNLHGAPPAGPYASLATCLYRAFLGRFPSDLELAFWTAELESGAQSLESMIVRFAQSKEFTAARRILANNGLAMTKGTTIILYWPTEGQPEGSRGFHAFRSPTGVPGSYSRINSAAILGGEYEDANLESGAYSYIIYLESAEGKLVQWTPAFVGVVGPAAQTPTPTPVPTPTAAPTPTPEPTPTPAPTTTPTPLPSTPTPTHTPTPTDTPEPTATPAPTSLPPSPTPTPSATPTPSDTPTPSPYDYPDPTGYDVHDTHAWYSHDYPVFIHDVKVWDYTGAYVRPSDGLDYPWHERNLTNSRGMYPIGDGGEGPFYWHGDKRAKHFVSDYGGSEVTSARYGPWLHEEVPIPSDPVYLEFDLGGVHPLSETWIWNYADSANVAWDNPAATYYKRGVQDVIIKYKRNALDAWTTLGAYQFGFPPAGARNAYGSYGANNTFGPLDDPNDTPFMRPVKWRGKAARYVQFEIRSNWGDDRFVGLNEVRFYREGAAIRITPDASFPSGERTRINPSGERDLDFGIVEVRWRREQEFLVWNAGSEGSSLVIDSLDASQLPEPFSIMGRLAPGTNIVGAPLSEGALATASLVTVGVDPADIGDFTGRLFIHYTDLSGSHVTGLTFKATGRYASWGSIPVVRADAWRSWQTWENPPSRGPWRMVDGTNMRDPAPGVNGARTGCPAWNYGWMSGYFGWYSRKHQWVAFDFGEVRNIDEMLFWNGRQANGSMKDVIISYTTEDIAHHGDPQAEPPPARGSYPSFANGGDGCWINAYGHYTGIEDTRWTPLAATNRSGDAPGAHQFRQVLDKDWQAPPESVDFGGVAARWVRFDSLHDGRGPWDGRPLPIGIQGFYPREVTRPPGYGNWGNDWAIQISQVRFYSGGPYPELLATIPAATGDMLRSSTNPYDLKPFEFLQFYPFVTTSTALVIGNVGDPGTTVRIQEITFMDENGDGTPDPGPFSIDLGSVALPKSYAAGTTEAVTLVWAPRRELATYDANVVVVADDGAGNLNKAVIPTRATAMAFEAGYVRPSQLASVVSLSQLDTKWSALSAYDRANFKEDPACVVGSKNGKSLRYAWAINPITGLGDWPGWLDAIAPGQTGRPPLEAPHWLEFDLGGVRTLDEMHIFQHQQGVADNWNAALKDIYIEYKQNIGDAWTRLGNKAWRIHNWYISDGAHPVEAPPANQINTHAPFEFPAATQAQFVRIVAAGPIGDADPTTTALQGNWGSTSYWGCAEIALYEPAPEISVDVDALNFGYVPAGTVLTKSFVIANVGKKTLHVNSIDIEGSSAYALSGSVSFTLDPGASRTVELTYTPASEGEDGAGTLATRSARIVITHDASGTFLHIALNGSAVAPATPSNPDSDIGAYEAREFMGR